MLRELTPDETKLHATIVRDKNLFGRFINCLYKDIKKKEVRKDLSRYLRILVTNLKHEGIFNDMSSIRIELLWLHIIDCDGKLPIVPTDFLERWLPPESTAIILRELTPDEFKVCNIIILDEGLSARALKTKLPVHLISLLTASKVREELIWLHVLEAHGAINKAPQEMRDRWEAHPKPNPVRGRKADLIVFDDLLNVEREYFPPVTNKLTPERTMKAELTVTKVNDKVTSTTINDQEVDHMDTDQIIGHIQKTEAKVSELENIKIESKAIEAEIKRLNKFIKDVVVLLDKK